MKRLFKDDTNKMICGVCSGIAAYFGLDPSLVRVGWVILSFATASLGFWAYLVCALILPKRSEVE